MLRPIWVVVTMHTRSLLCNDKQVSESFFILIIDKETGILMASSLKLFFPNFFDAMLARSDKEMCLGFQTTHAVTQWLWRIGNHGVICIIWWCVWRLQCTSLQNAMLMLCFMSDVLQVSLLSCCGTWSQFIAGVFGSVSESTQYWTCRPAAVISKDI